MVLLCLVKKRRETQEEEMATHSSILARWVPWTGELGGLLSIGSHRVGHNWSDLACMHACIGEGNGNPHQYSCPVSPVDRGAWWAAVHGVAQSRARLKWLSSSSRETQLFISSSADLFLKYYPLLKYCLLWHVEMSALFYNGCISEVEARTLWNNASSRKHSYWSEVEIISNNVRLGWHLFSLGWMSTPVVK